MQRQQAPLQNQGTELLPCTQPFRNACLLCKQKGFFLLGHVKVDLAANLQIITTVQELPGSDGVLPVHHIVVTIPEADLRLIGNPLVKFFCDMESMVVYSCFAANFSAISSRRSMGDLFVVSIGYALYGTGFHGALRPSGLAACGLIRRLHKSDTFVLAVDLPSGINTDTGEVAEGAAHADLTVTFDSYKPLHMAEASAPLCGKIICADIGIRDEWHPEF